MTPINDGGPAFPRPATVQSEIDAVSGVHEPGSPGMSLRDYFAGQAIAGLARSGAPDRLNVNEIAEAAYRIADALLARRGKGGAS